MAESLENKLIAQKVGELLKDRPKLSVLEVGCGSISYLPFGDAAHITGIDISAKQLERNAYIHDKIQGDIHDYPLKPETFDIAVCWDVIEHLARPYDALKNIGRSLKENGLIVLAAPNFMSIKGLVTKLTPIKAHVFFYRYIIGDTRAGTEDFGPFPTFLKTEMWPSGIRRFAANSGFAIEYENLYEGPVSKHLRMRHKLVDLSFGLIGWASSKFTLGSVNLIHSDYHYILRKTSRGVQPIESATT